MCVCVCLCLCLCLCVSVCVHLLSCHFVYNALVKHIKTVSMVAKTRSIRSVILSVYLRPLRLKTRSVGN